MAVPKKKRSKSKRGMHRSAWSGKARLQAQRALSLGKSILTGRSKSFYYPQEEDEDDDE
ncbi:MAG: 50S ribosomal protein L32 [Cyanobacteria bacterium P01_A01_bin.37]